MFQSLVHLPTIGGHDSTTCFSYSTECDTVEGAFYVDNGVSVLSAFLMSDLTRPLYRSRLHHPSFQAAAGRTVADHGE